jgi:Flp pilus assembly protein TadD
VDLTPLETTPALQEAIRCHRAGQAAEAEPLYRQILSVDPSEPDALHLLGVLALQAGRVEEAESLVRQSLSARRSQRHWSFGYR